MWEISWQVGLILIGSGVLVGFINTLAGGATIISMTTFMALGLPINVANGTNRIAIIAENFTAAANFFKKGRLNLGVSWRLSIPTIIGNIIGSQIAVTVNEHILKICLGTIFLFILGFLAFSSDERLKGDGKSTFVVKPFHYLWFLLIGLYGGYIFVGIGYVILTITMLTMKMDIVTANAIKGFVIMVSTPFSLIIFLVNGEAHILYGVVHAFGNALGAYSASQWATDWNVHYLKYTLMGIVVICSADLFGLISIKHLVESIL